MHIIIDGNSFLNVSASIVKTMLVEDPAVGRDYWVQDLMEPDTYLLKRGAKLKFREFSLGYLSSLASVVPDAHSVFLVFDSPSWRKKYIRERTGDSDEPFEYKGHRKYDPHQHLFYIYFQEELLPQIAGSNLHVMRVHGAEGDDIIARVLEKNPSSDFCIWSTDLDFCQLLEDGARQIVLTTPKQTKKYKQVYTPLGFRKDRGGKKPVNIFDLSMDKTPNFIEALVKKGYEHIEIDPRTAFLAKILGGDSSDNIPRVHAKMTKKKVEATVAAFVTENPNLFALTDGDPERFVADLLLHTAPVLKVTSGDEMEALKRSIDLNLSIIRLRSRFFPENIISAIDGAIRSSENAKFNIQGLKAALKISA